MEDCRQLTYMRSLSPGKAIFYFKTEENDFNILPVETIRVTSGKSGFS